MQNFRNPLILTAPKIYLDTSQLPAGGGAVSEWNSFATAEFGGAGLPTLKTDETYRYVRFGTPTDATMGNYLNLGTQTWNLQKGFTFVGVVRLYENKTFQRIFDLGNAGTSSAFLLYRQLNESNYLGSVVYSGTTQNISTSHQNFTHGSWMLLVLRIPSANLVETFRDPSSSLLDNKVTGNGTITNYSSRTTTDNSIAKSSNGSCLDVREMAFYDRSITDSELSDVVGHLHYKYFSNPLLCKGPKIHLDASQLPQLSIDNTNVSSWNSFATAEVGGAGLPKLRSNEPNRYVHFGTTDATNSKGNYLNLGTQTWNLQNKFTFVGVVRLYQSKIWQRIFDFGNGAANNNLCCSQYKHSSILFSQFYSGISMNISTSMNFDPGSWMVIVTRVTNANLLETWKDPSSNLIDNKVTGTGTITSYAARTLTNNWIGRSNWAGGIDSYACLDVREMAFYDRSLTDSELSDVVSYMRIKHFGDSIPIIGPLSIKSILDFVDPGGSSGENPYAMDKLFRGSRTPKYISSITRIPLAATEPARISFADFRGAGLTESPADVIGLYAWYTPESWDVGTKSWNDISGNGRHATETRAGTITVGDSTDPLGRSITCISGGTVSGLRFPADVLPETYTLFHLARYSTGGIQKRMFDGLGNNWLSGFHIGGSGLAYHGTWFTPEENLHGDEWVVSCDTKQLYRSNKVQRNNQIVIGNSTRLTINYGRYVVESSDWACAEVIVFDRELTNAEMLGVEEYLYKKHSLTII